MGRYDRTEFEWKTIQPLLPNKPRGLPRVDDRRVLNGIFRVSPVRLAVGRCAGALWPADHDPQPRPSLAKARYLGSADGRYHRRS